MLARGHRLGASAQLALTLAALVILLIANLADLITINLRGAQVSTTLPAAIVATWRDDAPLIAVLVTLTAIVAPALFIGLRLALLLPLALGRQPRGLGPVMRLLHFSARWNTVAVLSVGALLSLVRIAALARASAGPGLVALAVLGILLASIESAGLRHLWAEHEH